MKVLRMDFEIYSQLVRAGRLIAFHDFADHPSKTECAVNAYWNEIKKMTMNILKSLTIETSSVQELN